MLGNTNLPMTLKIAAASWTPVSSAASDSRPSSSRVGYVALCQNLACVGP